MLFKLALVTCDLWPGVCTYRSTVYLTWFDCNQTVLSFWYCKYAQNAFKREAILFCHISQVNIISPSHHWSENSWWFLFSAIHHFHEDHNAACLTTQIFTIIVFYLSRKDCNTQEKLETTVMQNLGGQTRWIMVCAKMMNGCHFFPSFWIKSCMPTLFHPYTFHIEQERS